MNGPIISFPVPLALLSCSIEGIKALWTRNVFERLYLWILRKVWWPFNYFHGFEPVGLRRFSQRNRKLQNPLVCEPKRPDYRYLGS